MGIYFIFFLIAGIMLTAVLLGCLNENKKCKKAYKKMNDLADEQNKLYLKTESLIKLFGEALLDFNKNRSKSTENNKFTKGQ